MKRLTKAEEEIMLILWRLKEAVVRDVMAQLEEPETPYTTVSTVIRVLEKKGFITHRAVGTTHIYYPLIQKKEYSRFQLKNFVTNYFNGSFHSMASFFALESKMDLAELKEIISNLEKDLNQNSDNE
ncbi:MAG: BlaI/MecI/CopY family transcriptional regulator [Bacteroidales bacterium]|nr:BlaI/MecI/CopY family transcriptional regulator [Bacteroidales bacterium]